MLEHQKTVLQNLSDNRTRFRKELIKSLIWLNSYEQTQLRRWLRENYWQSHKDVIEDIFYPKLEGSVEG